MNWSSWAAVVLGLWLIAAPFVLGYAQVSTTALYNDVIVGIAVAILSFIALNERRRNNVGSS